MTVKELFEMLTNKFPLSLQEGYDNSGPQIMFGDLNAERVLISLETDDVTISEAVERGCRIIISHHPFLFKGASKISTDDFAGRNIIRLIDERISVMALHTNLDKIYFSKLASSIGLAHEEILFPDKGDDARTGFGSISRTELPMKLGDLLSMVKTGLKADYLLYGGDENTPIERVALLNGAGGRMIPDIFASRRADCVITGDVGYHDARFAEYTGIPVIDAGHFFTERIFLAYLKSDILDCLTLKGYAGDIELIISDREKSPFRVFQ